MNFRLLTVFTLLTASLAGCAAGGGSRTPSATSSQPFTFEWREGPWIFSKRVKITDHQAVCILPIQDAKGMTTNYRRLTFNVTDAQLADLRQMLLRGGFASLQANYNAAVMDGTYTRVTVTEGSDRKDVTAKNESPPLFTELRGYIFDTLIPQSTSTAKVELLSQQQSVAFWNDVE